MQILKTSVNMLKISIPRIKINIFYVNFTRKS